MKKFSKKTTKLLLRFLCFFMVCTLILIIPSAENLVNDNLDRIYGSFIGEKSAYRGIIEIWNIDTFESGSASKSSFLNEVAKSYQQKYKGVYVLIRNITEKECENMILQGQKPDLFSCSYGVSTKIKECIQSYQIQDFNLKSNFLEAGKDKIGNLYGVAWCSGLYFLITTKTALSKASVDYHEGFSLVNNALSLGYVTSGKKQKNIYSLSFATKGYLMPRQALFAYNDSGTVSDLELSYNKSQICSQYEAYIDFLVGKSVILLGSQRDVVRVYNREKNGKIQDVVVKPLLSFTDLVQFMFISQISDKIKLSYIEKFVEFLLNEKNQAKLAKYNLFSPVNFGMPAYEIDIMKDLTSSDLENLKLNNVFLSVSEIEMFQQK